MVTKATSYFEGIGCVESRGNRNIFRHENYEVNAGVTFGGLDNLHGFLRTFGALEALTVCWD
jgi:hypothetical protein